MVHTYLQLFAVGENRVSFLCNKSLFELTVAINLLKGGGDLKKICHLAENFQNNILSLEPYKFWLNLSICPVLSLQILVKIVQLTPF